ncbi:Hypothetical protein CAP_6049 [Chondromyces apiculatus DSM 436]|uniref:Uncharacterized protein n=1 Tax=Chondromyces apiculatus DSM 436 TaxID=1192034 RepID=A0A017TG60_9BACT|nr:Hypothetical protein CAP_6049 [Chondromyces apiculatus DSM 436]
MRSQVHTTPLSAYGPEASRRRDRYRDRSRRSGVSGQGPSGLRGAASWAPALSPPSGGRAHREGAPHPCRPPSHGWRQVTLACRQAWRWPSRRSTPSTRSSLSRVVAAMRLSRRISGSPRLH